MRFFKVLGVVLCSIFLFACVTTTTGEPKVDMQAALEANIKLGMAYLEKGSRDGALRSFSKALDIDKNSSEANLGMALLHQLNGEAALADKSFKLALKGRSDFSRATVQFSYGKFLLEQKKPEQALKYFELVSQDFTYARRAQALYFLGVTALDLGDATRARGAFEYALNLKPDLPGPAIELAELSFNDRDYANAKKNLEIFAKNSRHTPRSLWLGIRLERIFGNKDKEGSYAMALKNMHPYSKEYLEYKNLIEENN